MAALEAGIAPAAARAAAAQRHRLPLEPADLRHRRRHARTCGSRTACCRPARPIVDVARQRGVLLRRARGCWPSEDRPVWTKMSFAAAEAQLPAACARRGIDAPVYWPGFGELSADELVLRHLLPLAHEGLQQWGVSDAVRDRYLGVIEGRCKSGRTAPTWQVATVAARWRRAAPTAERAQRDAASTTSRAWHANEPVHTWKVP